jgi:hypothetical protein
MGCHSNFLGQLLYGTFRFLPLLLARSKTFGALLRSAQSFELSLLDMSEESSNIHCFLYCFPTEKTTPRLTLGSFSYLSMEIRLADSATGFDRVAFITELWYLTLSQPSTPNPRPG